AWASTPLLLSSRISARMEIAISPGVLSPSLSPMGACSRGSSRGSRPSRRPMLRRISAILRRLPINPMYRAGVRRLASSTASSRVAPPCGIGSAASPAVVRAYLRSQEPESPSRSWTASWITRASRGPPPTLPLIAPSTDTIIFAPASRGAERAVAVTVQSTNGSLAALLRAASWNSSASVRFTLWSVAQRYPSNPCRERPSVHTAALAPAPYPCLQARRDRSGGGVRLRRDGNGPRHRRRDQPALLRSGLPRAAEGALSRGQAQHPGDHPEHL